MIIIEITPFLQTGHVKLKISVISTQFIEIATTYSHGIPKDASTPIREHNKRFIHIGLNTVLSDFNTTNIGLYFTGLKVIVRFPNGISFFPFRMVVYVLIYSKAEFCHQRQIEASHEFFGVHICTKLIIVRIIFRCPKSSHLWMRANSLL